MTPDGLHLDGTRYATGDRFHLPPLPETTRVARDERTRAIAHCDRRNRRRGIPRVHEPIRHAA